jgi:hypothetical protein
MDERELERLLHELGAGPAYRFADWPNELVPRVAAGVYTVWEQQTFVYVGMAGRTLTAEQIQSKRATRAKPTGLFDRLTAHSWGRRSGDQFCVYVCDLLILPQFTPEQLRQVGRRELSLDALVRNYIWERLSYRYVEVPDGASARELELEVKHRGLQGQFPRLNPLSV